MKSHRNMRHWNYHIILLLVLVSVTSIFVFGKELIVVQSNESTRPLEGPLVSPLLLKEAGLKQDWSIQLPIKPGEILERVFIYEKYLLLLTDQNYLFCRNRNDGSYRFEMRLAGKDIPVCDPFFYKGKIAFIMGSSFRVIDPLTGVDTMSKGFSDLSNNFENGVARNDRFLYLSAMDDRVHAFLIEEGYVRLFTATADNDSGITSLLATSDRVVFTTDSGNVVAMHSDRPEKIWQYNISGPIVAKAVLDGQSVYISGEDSKLYRLSLKNGKSEWPIPFLAGTKLSQSVSPGARVLYQPAAKNGLYAVDKESGRTVWNVANGVQLLCESGDQAYVYARPGILQVMDNVTAKPVYSMNLAGVNRTAINLQDTAMYLANESGRVICVSVP